MVLTLRSAIPLAAFAPISVRETVSAAVLLLDEPTQGVDVAAREEFYTLIRRAAAAGTAVVVVSNDSSELTRLGGRVVVLRGGRIAAELTGQAMDSHRLTELAYLAELEERR
jgi:ABC-type sugar transport system ATPase subunit